VSIVEALEHLAVGGSGAVVAVDVLVVGIVVAIAVFLLSEEVRRVAPVSPQLSLHHYHCHPFVRTPNFTED